MKMTGGGMLGHLKAKLCAEVLSALDDDPETDIGSQKKKSSK